MGRHTTVHATTLYMRTETLEPDTEVLTDDEPPAVHCPYCEQPFDSERSCALHVGEVHPDELSDIEKDAYEEAVAAEEDDLWTYHIKIVVGLGVTYAAVVLIYMIILGSA